MITSKKWLNIFILIFLINIIVLNLYKTRVETSRQFSLYQIFKKKPTIFCIILTNPRNFLTKTLVVNSTWAQECDEHRFLSVIPDFYLNFSRESKSEPYEPYQGETREISYPYNLLQPSGFREEHYNALTTKMYKAYIDIHKLYPNYDWYLKADDDTYIFMDHLREFLKDKNSTDSITYGFNLKKFQSGGAGYVMSNQVIHLFGENMVKNESFCRNEGREDLDFAACLRKLNVTAGKTDDELGRERFHPYYLVYIFYSNFKILFFQDIT